MSKYDDPIPSNPDNGVVRGDSRPMPNRGTDSGSVGYGAPYGADTGINATNRMGSARESGDPMMDNVANGDTDRFSSSGHTHASGGRRFSAPSDPAAECYPDDPRGAPDPDAGKGY